MSALPGLPEAESTVWGSMRFNVSKSAESFSAIASSISLGKRFRIINRRSNLCFWPPEVFGDGRDVSLIAAEQENHPPHGERAPLNIGLPACR
jgi:hypothetical protein